MKRTLEKIFTGSAKSGETSSRELGDSLRDVGAWAQAAKHYGAYLEEDPNNVAILVQYGHVLKEAGQREEALAAYDRALALSPKDDDIHLNRGHALKLMGRISEATKAYRHAFELSPENSSALRELVDLAPESVAEGSGALFESLRVKRWILLDVTDILQYARVNVSLSGIQRVVSTLIQRSQEWGSHNPDWAVVLVAADFVRREITTIDASIMREMLAAIETGSFTRQSLDQYLNALEAAKVRIEPRSGDVLTMAGAFWIYRNYDFLTELKGTGVGFCLFVHDLLQITHPEYVEKAATDVFRTSILDVLTVVDFVLCNSEFVADDVRRYLRSRLNFEVPVRAVLLATELPAHVKSGRIGEEIRAVAKKPFALSVGTIEIRKNHLVLVKIWEELLRRRVPDLPDLVFVGKWGWQIDELRQHLNRSDYLRGKLHIFTAISDAELNFLYEQCLFTLYPSFAEGFGLPVGESLGFGKPCIASSSTSIPEVGGRFARYMDPTSVGQGVKLVEQIVTDRRDLEDWTADIQHNYKAKTRTAFADEFFDAVRDGCASKPIGVRRSNCLLPSGRIILGGNDDVHRLDALDRPLTTFRMARTFGWHQMEGWGCWARSRRSRLEFYTDLAPGTAVVVYLKVSGPRNSNRAATRIFVNGAENELQELHDAPFWCTANGVVSDLGLIEIEMIASGEFSRPDDRDLFIGLHAIAFASADKFGERISVVEAITMKP